MSLLPKNTEDRAIFLSFTTVPVLDSSGTSCKLSFSVNPIPYTFNLVYQTSGTRQISYTAISYTTHFVHNLFRTLTFGTQQFLCSTATETRKVSSMKMKNC